MGPLGKKGVFFRTESALPKLSFADDVYDLVVCNLGLGEMPSMEVALRDFARVAKMGGEVRCTLPLSGSFQEFHDLYREVLIKHDKHEALERLERHAMRYPTVDHVERCMKTANLVGGLEVEEFALLFKSSREFFFAPVIEYGPLAEWKDIAGGGQEMQDVFWYIKEAIDAYFDGRPFQVTIKAGCLIGRKEDIRLAREPATSPFSRSSAESFDDDIDTGLPLPPQHIAAGSVRVSDPAEIELDTDSGDFVIDEDSIAEQELDAFIEGKKRPSHLDD
jgi:SAM-dependent methyltransferase